MNDDQAYTTYHAGQFSGEISQLAGRPTIARGCAGPEGCTALPFDAPHLRALMVGSADVGEISTHFLTKTKPCVATEIALHVLTYNLTRVLNIIRCKAILKVIAR